jgi:hypothetical protein
MATNGNGVHDPVTSDDAITSDVTTHLLHDVSNRVLKRMLDEVQQMASWQSMKDGEKERVKDRIASAVDTECRRIIRYAVRAVAAKGFESFPARVASKGGWDKEKGEFRLQISIPFADKNFLTLSPRIGSAIVAVAADAEAFMEPRPKPPVEARPPEPPAQADLEEHIEKLGRGPLQHDKQTGELRAPAEPAQQEAAAPAA